jgi:uncharacterized coiled-coil protein SlyX
MKAQIENDTTAEIERHEKVETKIRQQQNLLDEINVMLSEMKSDLHTKLERRDKTRFKNLENDVLHDLHAGKKNKKRLPRANAIRQNKPMPSDKISTNYYVHFF